METGDQNQTSTQLLRVSQGQPLAESKESKAKLDSLLLGCFAAQKLYGRDTGNAEAITDLFHAMLAPYPAVKVIRAFETWLERSQEFPTPADIIGLIKRSGRAPVKESDVIAIRKKEVCDWTRAEGELVAAWERQQAEKWTDDDPVKEEATLQENIRLRQEIKTLREENKKAWDEVKRLRKFENISIKIASETEMDKIERTIAAMQAGGAKSEDIEAFRSSYA